MTLMLAPAGDSVNAIEPCVEAIEPDSVLFFTYPGSGDISDIAERLRERDIEVETHQLRGDLWEAMFEHVAESQKRQEELIFCVSTGDKYTSCIAVSAAFVNGIKAVGVNNGDVQMLPIMQFSYHKQLSERKRELLQVIHEEPDCCGSLDELSEKTGLSKPLISYHVNGNLKSDGLEDLGLVATRKVNGRKEIMLTTQGRLLVKGYV